MRIWLILAIAVALMGFLLLLKPEVLWLRLHRDQERPAMSNAVAALLRLVGIGVLFLSVLLARMV